MGLRGGLPILAALLGLGVAACSAGPPAVSQEERTACSGVVKTPTTPGQALAFAVTGDWVADMERSGDRILASVGREFAQQEVGQSNNLMSTA